MEITADKFIFCEQQARACTFSLKSALPVSVCDFFALPAAEYSAVEWMTFKTADCGRWKVVSARVHALTITIVDEVFRVVKQAVCHVVRACKKFAYSNLRRGRRVAPMVPMALRL